MLSRRELVGKAAVGAAAVLTAGAARAAVGSNPRVTEATANPEQMNAVIGNFPAAADSIDLVESGTLNPVEAKAPWELLHPLTVGSTVASGWKIADLTGAIEGSCVVTLENDRGRQNRVHICRNDGTPSGIVYTKHFDLIAMNGGKGDLPTEESFARAIAELAHVLAANEGSTPVVASLVPHAERLAMCGESDRRLR